MWYFMTQLGLHKSPLELLLWLWMWANMCVEPVGCDRWSVLAGTWTDWSLWGRCMLHPWYAYRSLSRIADSWLIRKSARCHPPLHNTSPVSWHRCVLSKNEDVYIKLFPEHKVDVFLSILFRYNGIPLWGRCVRDWVHGRVDIYPLCRISYSPCQNTRWEGTYNFLFRLKDT